MCQNVKKMSSCQKDVKLSKRCQMLTSQTCELWRRFTIKNNWHNEVDTYWCQFWHHIWWWPKPLKMCIESVFEHFLWPSYAKFFFVNLLHSPDVWLFDIWHLFDNLTSFWQLDIFLTSWHILTFGRPSTPPKEKYSFRTITPSQREILSQITREGTCPWPG